MSRDSAFARLEAIIFPPIIPLPLSPHFFLYFSQLLFVPENKKAGIKGGERSERGTNGGNILLGGYFPFLLA